VYKCPTLLPILSQLDKIHDPHIPVPEDPPSYYLPTYAWVFLVVSFPQVSPPKHCIHVSFLIFVLYALPISFLILSPEKYSVSSIDHY
jgi:hypothetical protein